MLRRILQRTVVVLGVVYYVVEVVAGHPCQLHTTGDWCHQGGYVSCPNEGLRPCQAGLVCEQFSPGVIYCVRPEELAAFMSSPAPPSTPSTSILIDIASVPPLIAMHDSASPSPSVITQSISVSQSSKYFSATPSKVTSSTKTSRTSSTPSSSTKTSTTSSSTTTSTTTTSLSATPRIVPASTTPIPTARTPAVPINSLTAAISTMSMSSSWPDGPIKAIYIDNHCWDGGFSFNTLVDAGYNLIILAFFINNAPFDCAIAWERLSKTEQLDAINYAHSRGSKIIVSAGGATESPYSVTTGTSYGEIVATWAVKNNLDGVDFDLENFGREFTFGALSTLEMVRWVADATNAARAVLGDKRLITHAPQPPYFGNNGWADGYGKIYNLAPTIDYFFVQFYNNGPTNTYETIFLSNIQGASVTEIAAYQLHGIPMSKIVVGKPVHQSDIEVLTEGYNSAQELNAIFSRAKTELGWNAGVMGWQWTDPTSNGAWIKSIYPS